MAEKVEITNQKYQPREKKKLCDWHLIGSMMAKRDSQQQHVKLGECQEHRHLNMTEEMI